MIPHDAARAVINNPVYPRDTDSPFPRQSDQDLTAFTYVFFGFIALLLAVAGITAWLMYWIVGC